MTAAELIAKLSELPPTMPVEAAVLGEGIACHVTWIGDGPTDWGSVELGPVCTCNPNLPAFGDYEPYVTACCPRHG